MRTPLLSFPTVSTSDLQIVAQRVDTMGVDIDQMKNELATLRRDARPAEGRGQPAADHKEAECETVVLSSPSRYVMFAVG